MSLTPVAPFTEIAANLSLPTMLESAVFVRLQPLVVLGELLDWLIHLCSHGLVAGG
jgi:hypothetical protein